MSPDPKTRPPLLINLPLGEFALPVPRSGSLESLSGYGPSAADGQEIHQRVQRKRAKADPLYQAEVAVSRIFERPGYRFQVNGRMDGIFRAAEPRIEEIKTSFSVRDLARRLAETPDHPYCLQLKSYGYFHWLEHGVVPRLSFHLVSSRNGASQDLELELELPWYRDWLELRLDELVREAGQVQKRSARRARIAGAFAFPFAAARPGQLELMATLDKAMAQGAPQLVQAPTGLGKTVGVLYPVLKEALARGQQVVYVTPKNSQHSVAEDAVERFRAAGARVSSLSITAKHKICLKEEPLCHPEYCEYARDYYGKLAASGVVDLLAGKKKLRARSFRKLGEEFQVCPYELQLEAVPQADVVICDYNYVFAPRSALGRVSCLVAGQTGKPNLVIDEAHNLPARAMDYYSPALSCAQLEQWRPELEKLPAPFDRASRELLEGCLQAIASCRQGRGGEPARIDPPAAAFLEQDSRLRVLQSRYLESSAEIRQGDPVLGLCQYWSDFTKTLELARDSALQEFFSTFHPQTGGGVLKITCCDASAQIAGCYAGYRQVVGFSATLKPFDYYAKLSGLDPEKVLTAEFLSPFPAGHRKLMIIPQISTKYAQRERNYAKIADCLERIVALRPGNYFAFFPSFAFLERVAGLFRAPQGFQVVRQERNMTGTRCEAVLEGLRAQKEATVVFAVQGGSFAEGMDYQGEMVIGAFVVGPPLPTFDLEREQMREYYQRRFGLGFEYAYAIPAMAKAIQAAGRVIRSETDRGIVVLMDSRFLEPGFSAAMPNDWFELEARELVSGGILKEVAEFWRRVDEPG
jgi:DNA excision repair protein ERCC-2